MNKTNPVRAIFGVIISFLMALSTTNIITSIYGVKIDYWMFSVDILVLIAIFTTLNLNKKSWLGYAGLGGVILFAGLCAFRDVFSFRTAIVDVYQHVSALFDSTVKFKDFTATPAHLATMVSLFSSIGIFFTIRMPILKKSMLIPMIWYLFVFGAAMFVSDASVSPTMVMIAVFGFLMMVIYECIRKSGGVVLETTLVYVAVPVFLVCLFLRIIFPYGSYNMQGFAAESYDKVLTTIDETLGTNLKREINRLLKSYDPLEEKIKEAQSQLTRVDLSNLGSQNDEKLEMMTVQLSLVDGVNPEDYSRIYLRGGAKSIYNESAWYASPEANIYDYTTLDSLGYVHDDSEFYDVYVTVNTNINTLNNASYTYLYTPNKTANVAFDGNSKNFSYVGNSIKYFDNPDYIRCKEYIIDDFSSQYKFPLVGPNDLDPVPKWRADYLDYVYNGVDVEHIGVSIEDIMNSMPEWFVEVARGDIELTDAEKVVAVMDFLYNTKSYDMKVDYLPDGRDFVEWFINDCDSGYCVHFATAAAVLLRMLGVPTRYVTGYAISTPATKYEQSVDLTYYYGTQSVKGGLSYLYTEDGYVEYVYSEDGKIVTVYSDDGNLYFDDPVIISNEPLSASEEENSNLLHYNVYEYIVMDSDAHAWCEYFDPDYGWVGFDPTNNTFVPDTRGFVRPEDPFDTDYGVETVHKNNINYSYFVELEKEEREEEIQQEIENIEEQKHFNVYCFIAIAAAVLMFIVVRTGDIIIWRRKFTSGCNNDRVRAMCRYALLIESRNEITIPEKISELTDYAMYRREEITEDELSLMKKVTGEYVSRVIKNNRWWKVIQIRLLNKEIL